MPPTNPVDLTSLITAARNVPTAEHAWYAEAYPAAERRPLSDSLSRIEREAPKKLDDVLKLCGHGTDTDVLPWHLALMARASGVKTKTSFAPSTKPAFVVGSVHVKGPLQLKAPLVVTGDLTVDGPIIDTVEKWLLLVVGGTLEAHAIVSSQDVVVGGDCLVRDLLWGLEMHCPFVVRGKLKAPLAMTAGRTAQATQPDSPKS
jgi:hypothetical protein